MKTIVTLDLLYEYRITNHRETIVKLDEQLLVFSKFARLLSM